MQPMPHQTRGVDRGGCKLGLPLYRFAFSRNVPSIQAGRPITVTRLLRICEVFKVRADRLIRGLDKGI